MLKRSIVAIALISFAIAIGMTLGGCAKEEFRKTQFVSSGSSAGFRVLPPKVDIVMVPDNTPSVNTAFSILQTQFQNMMSSLRGGAYYWDYHVGRIPIAQPTDITQVLVNPEYNTNVLSDGTSVPQTSGIVPSSRAINDPAQFSILPNTIITSNADYTYSNLNFRLQRAASDSYTNFFRDDALLAIIVITNGADSEIDPDQDGTVNYPTTLQNYANSLRALKGGDDRLIRFYPISSAGYRSSGSCLGGTAFNGGSYRSMLNYLTGGLWFDFCDQNSLSGVMSQIERELQSIRQAYIYSYIVLSEEPVPASIQLFKNDAALSQSPTNGFEYLGLQTVFTITGIRNADGTIRRFNPGINERTGYVIKLNGSAEMSGSDVPRLIYEKR